jgi:peptide/nickel transport system substrate-binding protein
VGSTRGKLGVRAIALLAVMAMALGACSSDDDSGSPPGTGGSSDSGVADDVDPNGVITLGVDLQQTGGSGAFFDPAKTTSTANDAPQYLIFGRFYRPLQDGTSVPDQAESAEVVDANTIVVKIRPNQTFHDGSPFDAQAVKTGLDSTIAAKNERGLRSDFYALTSVDVVDPLTVRLNIANGRAASWFTFLDEFQVTIVKPGNADTEIPIGAGPMKVTAQTIGQSITLEKYDGYWDADSIKYTGMNLVHMVNATPQTITNALKTGEIDLGGTDPTQLAALTGNLSMFAREDSASNMTLMICKKDGPLANPAARKALNMAIDREALSEGAYAGTAAPGWQMWPEGYTFYNEEVGELLNYDPEGAKRMLAEAGYPNGFEFDMYALSSLGVPDAAQIMKEQLAAVGITANLKISNNYVADFLTPQSPGAGLVPGGSANRDKLNQFTGQGIGNTCSYSDPELNAIVAELGTVSDSDPKAKELWDEATDIIYNDALGGFYIFRSTLAGYNTDRLGDLQLWPLSNPVWPWPFSTYVKAS